MTAAVRTTRSLLVSFLVFAASTAAAQPTGWSSQRYFAGLLGFRYAVQVSDLGVGAQIARFDAPPGVELGRGALTPDGRYYLVGTNAGLARFTTTPPAFDRLLGPGAVVGDVFMAPIGTTAHVTGDFGRAVVDWQTGDVLSISCCDRPWIGFTPDGTRRLEVVVAGQYPSTQTILSVFQSASNDLLWNRKLQGAGSAAINNAHVAVSIADQVLILDTATGAEHGALPYALGGMQWRGEDLVAFRTISGLPGRERLSTYTLPALDETVLIDGPYYPGTIDPIALFLSADGRYAYWLHFVSVLGFTVSYTSYSVVDLDERRSVAFGTLGSQSQPLLSLAAESQCVIAVPDSLTAPARGSVIEVPAVPTPNCRPWLAPDAMNPGPHSGPVTIREQVDANTNSQPVRVNRTIGSTSIEILQAADRPAAPVLHGAVEGNRIHLRWDPSPGAGITAFEIRGAMVGGPESVESVASTRRDWISPPLGPGSYALRIVAGNLAGPGPSSNDVRLSIGERTPPEAPEDLRAAVADDQVTLTWAPPSTGPAPAEYVIEAAPVSTDAFVAVARSTDPSLRVTRTPPGPWHVRVRAATEGGVGSPSAAVLIAPSPCTSPPASPEGLWPVLTYPVFTLRWSPGAGSVDQYLIEVGSATGAADLGRLTVDGGQTSIAVPQVSTRGTNGFARLRARNACGESAPSKEVVISLP